MRVNLEKYLRLIFILIPAVSLWSCQATRFLRPGEYLVQSKVKFVGNKGLKATTLQNAVKTDPNRRLGSFKTYLHIFNTGKTMYRDSTGFINRNLFKIKSYKKAHQSLARWLMNTVGEAPNILSMQTLRDDSINIRNLYFANGYFYPHIQIKIDTIDNWLNKQKARVSFVIDEGLPYKINELHYDIPNLGDTALFQSLDRKNSIITIGQNYSHGKMAAERVRITRAMKERGYFTFTQSMVEYSIDTLKTQKINRDSSKTRDQRWANLKIDVTESPPQYTIRHVQVNIKSPTDTRGLEYSMAMKIRAAELPDSLREALKIPLKHLRSDLPITFWVSAKIISRLNYNFLATRIMLREGDMYQLSNARSTQQRLIDMGMFQFAIVTFEAIDSLGVLDVVIDLQLGSQYEIKTGTELFTSGFTSSNLPSVGANIRFRNKNTFGRSEFFEFKIFGNVGFYEAIQGSGTNELYFEAGASANLNFPDLVAPFKLGKNQHLMRPSTLVTLSYREESRQEFDRRIIGTSLNYRWNNRPSSDLVVSRFTPLSIDIIDIRNIAPDFQDQILSLPLILQLDYENRFSSRISYSLTYSNYRKTRAYNTFFVRGSAELGGNLPWLLDKIIPDSDTIPNVVFGSLRYGQYFKLGLEGKYYMPMNSTSEIVLRASLGYSSPFNGTGTVPKESRYFTGGTNTIRGWRTYTLGPGRTALSDFAQEGEEVISNAISPGGEILMEVNFEYRFDLGSMLELALFTDAGNVWFNEGSSTSDADETQSLGFFRAENLVLGWDAGIGIRLDFNFLILRLDIAQQIYAPDLARPDLQDGWVIRKFPNDIGGDRLQFNLGIGYPF